VTSESLPWSSDEQHQFYVINLEGRSPGFDVMMLDVIWVPEFARAGWLLDLTDRVRPEELAPHFASTVAAATWAGRVWALPWNMNVGLLYYRADLLAKYGLRPPETWEELEAAVRTIRAGERDPRLEGYLWQGKQYEGMVVNVLSSSRRCSRSRAAPSVRPATGRSRSSSSTRGSSAPPTRSPRCWPSSRPPTPASACGASPCRGARTSSTSST